MRIFFAMGPGDIVLDERQARRMADPACVPPTSGETSITFSGQLVRLLEERGHEAVLVSSHTRADMLTVGRITLINLPRKQEIASGLGFYRSRIAYARRLAAMAHDSGADLAVIDSGTTCPFALWFFRRHGIPVAVNLHNVRWAVGFDPVKPVARIVRALDSLFFHRGAVAALGCSPACAVQVCGDGADALPYFGWAAQYAAEGFPDLAARGLPAAGSLRLLFVGRVERSKGVFDLIEIARGLRDRKMGDAHITICGDGSALEALRAAIADSDVADMMTVRGRLGRVALLAAYAESHLVIVPTRGDFTEGMPLVCAEAVLAFRPVLTSRVSNAMPVLGDAMMEAVPQDPSSYVDRIVQFAGNPTVRDRLAAATVTARLQFLDRSRSYAAAVDAMIAHVSGEVQPALDYTTLFPEAVAVVQHAAA